MEKSLEYNLVNKPICLLCESRAKNAYRDLHDQLFGVKGSWSISSCPNCGLFWLNPCPSQNEIFKFYQNYYTHSETTTSRASLVISKFENLVLERLGYRVKREKRWVRLLLDFVPFFNRYQVLNYLGVRAEWGKRLLDVGAGNGEFIEKMHRLGWDVEATETDEKAAAYLRSRLNVKIYVGLLDSLQLPANQYDVITLNHVLEHVYNPVEFLLECRRILRPNGRIVLLTPNSRSLAHFLFRRHWRGIEIPRHIHIFSQANVQILSQKVEMSIESSKTTARIARYFFSTSEHIRMGREKIGSGGNRGYILAGISMAFQLLEEILLTFRDELGEEIYLILKKS